MMWDEPPGHKKPSTSSGPASPSSALAQRNPMSRIPKSPPHWTPPPAGVGTPCSRQDSESLLASRLRARTETLPGRISYGGSPANPISDIGILSLLTWSPHDVVLMAGTPNSVFTALANKTEGSGAKRRLQVYFFSNGKQKTVREIRLEKKINLKKHCSRVWFG